MTMLSDERRDRLADLVSDPILSQILCLRDADGKITPHALVEAARTESQPLHNHFTWDNLVAAEQYRLLEARRLLRATVDFLPEICCTLVDLARLNDLAIRGLLSPMLIDRLGLTAPPPSSP